MNAHLTQFWLVGGICLLLAVSALALTWRSAVRSHRSNTLQWNGGGKIVLCLCLSVGILAFGLKMGIASLISSAPELLISRATPQPIMPRDGVIPSPPQKPQMMWESLPDKVPAPLDNPTTPAKVALGEKLFHDPNLSRNRTLSCASCHNLATGGADNRATAIGVNGTMGNRNTPTVFNAAFQSKLFWDGRARSLEQQAAGPLLNLIEMAMPSAQSVTNRVIKDPGYPDLFAAAFDGDSTITFPRITQAIAAFERTLVTDDSAYDRFISGDKMALNVSQKRGMHLFKALGCLVCHGGPNFSGASSIGPQRPFAKFRTDRLDTRTQQVLQTDLGAASEGKKLGVFRIPSLRNVAVTAPYFHNGSIQTLKEAVSIMVRAQINGVIAEQDEEQLWWSDTKQDYTSYARKRVSEQDLEDLTAFLTALTSERFLFALPDQHGLSNE